MMTYPISNVGGIRRWKQDLMTGLERLGHEVSEQYLEKSDYETPEDADLYIFTHSCPRQTKTQGFDEWWMRVYRDLEDEAVISVMHDPYWEKRYEWIQAVNDCIDMVVGVQEVVTRELEGLTMPWKMIRHPLDPEYATYVDNKEDMVMSASMFKSWKHVDHVVRVANNTDFDVRVHGQGIEYHYMSGEKRKEKYQDENGNWIWDLAESRDNFEYMGKTDFETLLETYQKSRFILDMSRSRNWQGVINYTQLEPMLFGTIPVMYIDTANDFIKHQVLTVSDWREIPDLIESHDDESLSQLRETNREWVLEHFGCEKIAQEYIDVYEEIKSGETESYQTQDTF